MNAQDVLGQAPLHIAVMRIAAEPDEFEAYKKIIKELLFNGANRSLRTESGHTPRDLLDDTIEDLERGDYEQLHSILTYQRPCLCFMRRRPMQKMTRSPVTLIFGVTFNLTSTAIYYIWLREREHGTPSVLLESLHYVFYWASLVLLLISLPLFVLSVALEPGYIKPEYEYGKLVEVALDIGLHLDNFCSYCKVIKSESSFHCTICNRCVELFDHHCPFINNCLGHRNHKFFLAFIFTFTLYLMVLMVEILRHWAEIYKEVGWSCFYTDSLCTTSLVLVTLHLPVFFFQWYQQCGNLCRKPLNRPPQLIATGEYTTTFSEAEHLDTGSGSGAKSNQGTQGVNKSVLVQPSKVSSDPQQQRLSHSFESKFRSGFNNSLCKESPTADQQSLPKQDWARSTTKTDRLSSRYHTESEISASQENATRLLKNPPSPKQSPKDDDRLNRLTKSLLEQHEAYQEIDPNDVQQQRDFIRQRERRVKCNLTYNLKAIWTHKPQT